MNTNLLSPDERTSKRLRIPIQWAMPQYLSLVVKHVCPATSVNGFVAHCESDLWNLARQMVLNGEHLSTRARNFLG